MLSLAFFSCSQENELENIGKNYSYNVNDIYTIPINSKNNQISDIVYVIPTTYKGENYDFMIKTLTDDGKKFNVTFTKKSVTYSVDYLIEDNLLFPIINLSKNDSDESFLSCVAGHEGAGVALLTGACAAITSFIPFLQPVAFACAAETAVVAAVVAADCATSNDGDEVGN